MIMKHKERINMKLAISRSENFLPINTWCVGGGGQRIGTGQAFYCRFELDIATCPDNGGKEMLLSG
jgi:hypothetical protein